MTITFDRYRKERLGHASITTTLNLYGHVLPSTEADALDGIYRSAAQNG